MALPIEETGADEFTHGAESGVAGIDLILVCVEDDGQLVHRQLHRVFVDQKRQDRAFCTPVFSRG